jgi:uncharacterized protein
MAWRSAAVLLVIAAACSSGGSSPSGSVAVTASPATDLSTAAPTVGSGVPPSGFDTVAGRVTAADGRTCDVCLWAARTIEQQERGLMGVTDLTGADGMIFRFGGPTTIQFWMRNTPTPLSIAFFAADGTFVSAADMEPCPATSPDADCARYAADGPYTDALEVAKGTLPDLLIGPGARLEVTDTPCPLRP